MGHLGQPQRGAELAPLAKEGRQAAVVAAQELTQHEQGEQLRLSEIVLREAAPIGGKRELPHAHRLPGKEYR